ncbi:hypothetical protein HETIRDRAFT_470070 [Heterobasidion irregulare TC 32-1]|uniref:Mid2 domain-containing protein n=1 Tax=Heterobasidion irregulare (strain TC 32-1) TaxID=747525 RepID=W4KGL6_HETIT|nr:uncharacterized protein HETIRDRAFT_470070 [Heterobasidion irregulare TC 32-1]ETW85003.1 hypothetical protein HETIRDRAFT_470070 [Heterobasidion irregulare TC 32-1]
MNFTLDDSAPQLVYSPTWDTQSSKDPDLASFFQSTYHTAVADGATVNFTFSGSAIFLYGSKGPGHGKYSVQCDNVIANLDAHASETQFRQLLFGYTFPNSTNAQGHFVSFTAHLAPGSNWVDLDYVTFSQGISQTSSSVDGGDSLTAPWETSSTGASTAAPFASSSSASASSSLAKTSESKTPIIVAAVLGTILGIILIIAIVILIFMYHRKQRDRREARFRSGSATFANRESNAGSSEEDKRRESPFPSASRGLFRSSDRGTVSSVARSDEPAMQHRAGSQVSMPVVPPRPKRGILSGLIQPSNTPGRYDDGNSLRTDFLQV